MLATVLAGSLAACSSAATPAPSAPGSAARVSLAIYGAASLKGVLDSLKVVYEAAVPGATLAVSTDSSAALATKIEQGAPADVFLSADTATPQRLADRDLAAGPVTVVARNSLTIIVPVANPAAIRSPLDLARAGTKIIAAGDNVPISAYTAKLIVNLAGQPGYPGDFAARYGANVVSKEANVAAIVAKVELGEGDAGVVYLTDARASSKVTSIAIPAGANVPAGYGGVVVKASRNVAAAEAFLAWLRGAEGQAVLASFGFLPPA